MSPVIHEIYLIFIITRNSTKGGPLWKLRKGGENGMIMHMKKYLTQENGIRAAVVVLVVAAAALFYFFPPKKDALVAPAADEQAGEVATTTLTEMIAETQEDVVSISTPAASASTESDAAPVALGARMPADSPASALQFFVEAVEVKDTERAVSYTHTNIKDQIRASIETKDSSLARMIATLYRSGRVGDVELVEPREGLYQIMLYPAGAELGYTTRYIYDTDTHEFVIVDL